MHIGAIPQGRRRSSNFYNFVKRKLFGERDEIKNNQSSIISWVVVLGVSPLHHDPSSFSRFAFGRVDFSTALQRSWGFQPILEPMDDNMGFYHPFEPSHKAVHIAGPILPSPMLVDLTLLQFSEPRLVPFDIWRLLAKPSPKERQHKFGESCCNKNLSLWASSPCYNPSGYSPNYFLIG